MIRVNGNGATFVVQGPIGTERVFDRRPGPRLGLPSFAQIQPLPVGPIGHHAQIANTAATSGGVTVWAPESGTGPKVRAGDT